MTHLEVDFARFYRASEEYRKRNGHYPPSLKGWRAFPPQQHKYRILGTEEVYQVKGPSFELYVVGFNRKDDEGRGDDIGFSPEWGSIRIDHLEYISIQKYVRVAATVLAVIFFVLAFWPNFGKKT